MAKIHFLNVDEGDCSIIQHDNGKVTMIDICCGNIIEQQPGQGENPVFRITKKYVPLDR